MKNKKIIIILAIVSILLLYLTFNRNNVEVYEVLKNKTEIYTETKAYVKLNESVIEYNKDQVIIPVANNKKRVSKNNIISRYKTEEYENIIKEIEEIDKEINKKIELLPEIYSSEVSIIENRIEETINNRDNINSVIDMNNYIETLNELTYMKVETLSRLSPSGIEIEKLLEKREEFTNELKESKNSIKSDVSGVVLYKVDGLENKYDDSEYTEQSFEELILDYDKVREETFGIKIVDNYNANIIVKIDKEYDDYIDLNKTYNLELTDNGEIISAEIVEIVENDFFNYIVFKVTNNIEQFIDSRVLDVRIIWDSIEGFIVPKETVQVNDGVIYVKWFVITDSIDIPVKLVYELEDSYIITNFTQEEKTKLNIQSDYYIDLYDRIIINKN